MEARNAIADILKQEGVEYLFCFPNSPIIDAAAGAEIRPIVARMERCAVNMADGYTRTLNGRRTGVLTVQAGPGIENAFGGIAQAYADSTPILVLPGQAGTDKLGTPSNFSGMENYRGITKWARAHQLACPRAGDDATRLHLPALRQALSRTAGGPRRRGHGPRRRRGRIQPGASHPQRRRPPRRR